MPIVVVKETAFEHASTRAELDTGDEVAITLRGFATRLSDGEVVVVAKEVALTSITKGAPPK